MTQREIDDMLWRAFCLGLRVMGERTGAEVSDIGDFARTVREIAEGELTLNDPTDAANRFPNMSELVHRLATLGGRHDRELAQRIFQGFIIASEVKD